VARILRALKAVRFFGDLRLMLDLIFASITGIAWAVIMILIVLFMCSLIIMQGVVAHLEEYPAQVHEFVGFQAVGDAMVTLLQAVTGGDDWIVAYVTLGRLGATGPTYQLFFVLFVLFFIMVLFNIITSLFLDRVMKFADPSPEQIVEERDRIEEHDVKRLREIFREFDHDNTGGISMEEFQQCVSTKKFGTFLAARGIDIKEARAFFDLVCRSGITKGGEVDVVSMVKTCTKMKGTASSVDLQILRHEIQMQFDRVQSDIADIIRELLPMVRNKDQELVFTIGTIDSTR
jgi:ABC-type multidrug transport system fused ATPase/permease subunit